MFAECIAHFCVQESNFVFAYTYYDQILQNVCIDRFVSDRTQKKLGVIKWMLLRI